MKRADVTEIDIHDLPEGSSRAISSSDGSAQPGGFVVRKHGKLFGYINRCPHTGAPLDWNPDQFLDADGAYILCATHGALFEIDSGLCVYGPCINQRLEPLPLEVVKTLLRRSGG